MSRKDMTFLELKALKTAGGSAGAYVDGLGKTDIAALSEEEWVIFLATIVNRFGEEIAKGIEDKQAPF